MIYLQLFYVFFVSFFFFFINILITGTNANHMLFSFEISASFEFLRTA